MSKRGWVSFGGLLLQMEVVRACAKIVICFEPNKIDYLENLILGSKLDVVLTPFSGLPKT